MDFALFPLLDSNISMLQIQICKLVKYYLSTFFSQHTEHFKCLASIKCKSLNCTFFRIFEKCGVKGESPLGRRHTNWFTLRILIRLLHSSTTNMLAWNRKPKGISHVCCVCRRKGGSSVGNALCQQKSIGIHRKMHLLAWHFIIFKNHEVQTDWKG